MSRVCLLSLTAVAAVCLLTTGLTVYWSGKVWSCGVYTEMWARHSTGGGAAMYRGCQTLTSSNTLVNAM